MKWQVWGWIVVAVMLAVLAPVQLYLDGQFKKEQAAWRAAYSARVAADRRATSEAQGFLEDYRALMRRVDERFEWELASQEQLARLRLNGGQPFEEVQGDGRRKRWVSKLPSSASGEAYLVFENGELTGVEAGDSASRIPSPDPNAGLHGAFMIGRRMIYMVLCFVWMFLALVWVAAVRTALPRDRLRGAVNLLLLALLTMFLASIGPHYFRALGNFLEDDSAGWGFIATVLSIIAVIAAIVRARRNNDPLACVNCQYNLTGNRSRVCPECGTPVADEQVLLIEQA